jgi:plastocyanin
LVAAGCGGSDPLAENPVDGDEETAELEPGDSFSRKFPAEGAFRYVCTLHPRDMEGEVRVGQ